MKTSKRQLTINGLKACGWREVKPAPSRKYLAYDRNDGQGRMFVGGSGALRWSRTGKASDSRSETDTASHKAYQEIGNPAIRWESVDQAVDAYSRIMVGKSLVQQPTLAHEIRQQITAGVCGRKEICVTKADAGYNQHNTDWIVIREDDSRFSELAAARPGQVRFVENAELYGDSTAYDFQGPECGQ